MTSADIIPQLSPPADLAAWMVVCYDEFKQSRLTRLGSFNTSRGQRYLKTKKIKELGQMYQRFKRLATVHYAARPALLQEFGFAVPTKRSAAGIMAQSALALATYARLLAAAEPDMLNASVAADLQSSYDEAAAELDKLTPVRSRSVQASGEYQRIWQRDTLFLRRLLALWYAVIGRDNGVIAAIGCCNPRPRRSGMPPPPENLRRENAQLAWDAAERATTYQVQYRPASPPEATPPAGTPTGKKKKSRPRTRINWLRLYQGEETQCPLPAKPSPTGYELRVRARNANGFGKWSAEYRTE